MSNNARRFSTDGVKVIQKQPRRLLASSKKPEIGMSKADKKRRLRVNIARKREEIAEVHDLEKNEIEKM